MDAMLLTLEAYEERRRYFRSPIGPDEKRLYNAVQKLLRRLKKTPDVSSPQYHEAYQEAWKALENYCRLYAVPYLETHKK
jgi:hypothetical protein